MKLRGKLNAAILVVFAFLGVGAGVITARWVGRTVMAQATEHVKLNIQSAWLIYDIKRERVQRAVQLLADEADWGRADQEELQRRLAAYRERNGLDFLTWVDTSGRVVLRSDEPFQKGDSLLDDGLVRAVVDSGRTLSGTILMQRERLEREGGDLLERCLEFGGEPTGMAVVAAAPLHADGKPLGYLEAGILLNGATEYVDRVRDMVFEDGIYEGKPVGTATIFMGDLRIATNVRGPQGKRAIGTRVSDEVAEQVLKRGESWTGRAWVVDAWYISQYDPIRDPDGRVIGMIYIGKLEKPYLDLRRKAVATYLALIGLGMAMAFGVFYLIARGILHPLQQLSEATEELARGNTAYRVHIERQDEIGDLARAFDQMARKLDEQRREIEHKQQVLQATNEELQATNRSYMDMLGFVSHELRNPLASSVMMLSTVTKGYLGELNEKQKQALARVDRNLHYFLDMIKNYLDLSRLEKGEMVVEREEVRLREEVVDPILDGLSGGLQEREMTVENQIPEDLVVVADRNLMRIVYDNLLANAVKYGRQGGKVLLEAEIQGEEIRSCVTNEGDGIPPDQLPLLFKKFSRLEVHKRSGKKGTGLGLYICKEIVERHGGRIWAESEPGQWARFCFCLPKEIARNDSASGEERRKEIA